MKTIKISLLDRPKLKKQIQAIARIAAKAGERRPYLQFLQFERIEGALRISATNGLIMSDVVIGSGFESDLEIGEKMHVHSKRFSKINESFLQIVSENGITTINNSVIAENLKQEFPDLERIRIKKDLPISITINVRLLKELADTLDSGNVITIIFDPEFPLKPALVSGKVSSGIIMPAIR